MSEEINRKETVDRLLSILEGNNNKNFPNYINWVKKIDEDIEELKKDVNRIYASLYKIEKALYEKENK